MGFYKTASNESMSDLAGDSFAIPSSSSCGMTEKLSCSSGKSLGDSKKTRRGTTVLYFLRPLSEGSFVALISAGDGGVVLACGIGLGACTLVLFSPLAPRARKKPRGKFSSADRGDCFLVRLEQCSKLRFTEFSLSCVDCGRRRGGSDLRSIEEKKLGSFGVLSCDGGGCLLGVEEKDES